MCLFADDWAGNVEKAIFNALKKGESNSAGEEFEEEEKKRGKKRKKKSRDKSRVRYFIYLYNNTKNYTLNFFYTVDTFLKNTLPKNACYI